MITRILKARPRVSIEDFEFCNADIGHEGQAPILSELNLKLPAHKFYWLKASAGVGRTTVMRVLSGLHHVMKGEFRINGQDVSTFSFEEFNPYRANLGYSFPQPTLLANRTLIENLQLPVLYHHEMKPIEVAERFRELSERFDLEAYREHRPFSIPGSYLKIAGVLRAFMREPEVVVLDDPFIGLTPIFKKAFIEFLEEQLRLGIVKTVFFATDDSDAIAQFNPTTLLLENGHLAVASDQPEKKAVGL